jgi:hypothetical protein
LAAPIISKLNLEEVLFICLGRADAVDSLLMLPAPDDVILLDLFVCVDGSDLVRVEDVLLDIVSGEDTGEGSCG